MTLAVDFEAKSASALDTLRKALEGNGLVAATPVFVMPGGDSSFQFAAFKVGYADKRIFGGDGENVPTDSRLN